ncbi:hypothetical protein NEFER03_1933 [Nematocida sp. LUAm3]|nr:hypothetical protein NEFER03_1933 [Nematocida sp. LUAm3]KAI5176165.1 hypothetical protein NEFER02_1979 [Nematocida sp. LUAm2]KAI5179259.1 hypothetical protein NEFER01_2111 [Nematocida sp. LUAm1]
MKVVLPEEWIVLSSPLGPFKWMSMKKDKNRIIRIGNTKLLPSAFLNVPYHKALRVVDGAVLVTDEKIEKEREKKEERKHRKDKHLFWISPPSLEYLAKSYKTKEALDVSEEALSQILFHSVGYEQVIVKDHHHSLVLAAVGIARGASFLYRIDPPYLDIRILEALGLPNRIPEYSPETLKQVPTLIVIAEKTPTDPYFLLSLLQETYSQEKEFLLFHKCKDALLDIFNFLMKDKRVFLLELREVITRKYQSKLGSIHPEMSKKHHSGFILSGTFLNTRII